jgi:lipid A 3-O-deacylase
MRLKFFLLFPPLLFFGVAFAQVKTYQNEAGIQSDNDGFLAQKSDRYYTAGNFGYYRHALKIADTAKSKLANKILGFELGQKIFNPQTGAIPDRIFIDRPFAGYLYLGTNLNLLYKNESNLKLQARIGMVGQHAFGEEIQDVIHDVIGFYHPTGWQYQVRDAFQLNLSAEYNRLLTRDNHIDLSLTSHADLGTGITGAGAGFLVRLGKFNQLFNSAATTSTVSANANLKPFHDSEFFFYYKPVLNVVVYDATIQGGLFEKQAGPDEVLRWPNLFLFTQQVGGSYVKNRWVLDASVVFESRETEQMSRTNHWGHQWGALSAMYRF